MQRRMWKVIKYIHKEIAPISKSGLFPYMDESMLLRNKIRKQKYKFFLQIGFN